ncbi:MAG: response regulator [Candidatus Saganbacteria bacterium]|nr:response regulator [Candidatus Saganbacteria bacterium]
MNKILIFSKDPSVCPGIENMLSGSYNVHSVSDLNEALEHMRNKHSDIIVIDGDCEGINGLEAFKTIKSVVPHLKAVMISKKGNINEAVAAAKKGVLELIPKPLSKESLEGSIEKIISRSQYPGRMVIPDDTVPWLEGTSAVVQEMFVKIEEAALSEQDVMLIGTIGASKKMVGRLIHDNSPNRKKKFIELNLTAFEKESSESMFWTAVNELLADHSSDTRSEKEASGTIFLDGFDLLPVHFEQSILEFLKNRSAAKIDKSIKIILGTAGDIAVSMEGKGKLIEDFIKIRIPEIEERKEDIPAMLKAYTDKFCARHDKNIKGFSSDALQLMMDYSWPGNCDELSSVAEAAVLRAKGDYIDISDLPVDSSMILGASLKKAMVKGDWDLSSSKDIFHKRLINTVLKSSGNDTDAASRILDVPKTTILDSVKKLGIRI